MYKKELVPGVVVYRPKFKLDEVLHQIKNDELIKSRYEKWGAHARYYQGDVSFMKSDDDKVGQTDALKEIERVYKKVFYEYLKDNKNSGILPPFIKYSGKGKSWAPLAGGLLQIHGKKQDDQDSNLGLGFHLDIATNDRSPGWKHIFTIIFYLNDNYDDGEICFTYGNSFNDINFPNKDTKVLKYKPKAGDLVAFPAHYPHAAYKAYKEDRYVFLSTCSYKTEEGQDMSAYLPEDPSILLKIRIEGCESLYINGADI